MPSQLYQSLDPMFRGQHREKAQIPLEYWEDHHRKAMTEICLEPTRKLDRVTVESFNLGGKKLDSQGYPAWDQ